ncbi:unnamed protein product [Orchesella dallaii]|uniref:Uncharacterized protein n=1 Tax=Orchesella dallaii TaxID=48710 RepID=A0ABP1QHY6_9HEXA
MVVSKIVIGILYCCLFGLSVSIPQIDRRVRNNVSGIGNTRARTNFRREKYSGRILFEDLNEEPLLPRPRFSSKLPGVAGITKNTNLKPPQRVPVKDVADNFITTKRPSISTSPISRTENMRTTTVVISDKVTPSSVSTPKTTTTASNAETIRTEEPILEGHFYIPFRKMADKSNRGQRGVLI